MQSEKTNLKNSSITNLPKERKAVLNGSLTQAMELHLVQIEPVPDNTDEEADSEQPPELNKPGHRGPQLSAYDGHHHQHTEAHLE